MISFFLTTKCNLRCIYCYNNKERNSFQEKSLPLDIAEAGIDEFFQKNKSRHIRFYGPGEPTMELELMKKIVNYARKKTNEPITVELQTNGAFSNMTRIWLLDNVNIIWISFDGTPDIQDKQRPFPNNRPSSPVIEENIRWLNQHKGQRALMIGARVTITDLNVSRQLELIDYFSNLGIKYIWTDPIFPEVRKIPVCEDLDRGSNYYINLDTYVDYFLIATKYAREKNIFYGSFLTCNFDGETKCHCRACTPVPHLTPDGYVSACDLVVFGEKAYHMDCFIYAKWDEFNKKFIYDIPKIKTLNKRNVDNLIHCKNCIARLHCGGYCLGEVQNETGRLDGQKKLTCKAIQRLYRELGPLESYDYFHP